MEWSLARHLLLAPRLALRPARVGLGILLILLLSLALRAPMLWLGKGESPFDQAGKRARLAWDEFSTALFDAQLRGVWASLAELFVEVPRDLVVSHPWSTLVLVPLLALAWSTVGVAIARLASIEFAEGKRRPWTHGVAFAVRLWRGAFGSAVLPFAVAGVLLLMVAALGSALQVPGLGYAVAGLFVVVLVLVALAAAFVVIGALGLPLSLGSIVCDGTDTIDATQRQFAYVIARPVRFALFGLALASQGVVLVWVLGLFAGFVVSLTHQCAGAWLPEQNRTGLELALRAGTGDGAMTQILAFWGKCVWLVVAGVAASYFCGSASVLYLLMRRACDGQSERDLWWPGMVPGTSASIAAQKDAEAANAITSGDDDE